MSDFKFTNAAPEDKEWTAGVNLLNDWTEPDRHLRHIVQYARSGKFYPADMHVDLIQQIIDHKVAEAERVGAAFAIKVLDDMHLGTQFSDTTDRLFKGLKNTIRDRFEAVTGVDPAPNYPIKDELKSAKKLDK